jgi:hypothetical protein
MIIRIGMFMGKILQYSILILFGLNSAYALSNPFKAMSNMATGCKPSVIRDIAKLLPKARGSGDPFDKKVDTMIRCIGDSAATLKQNHADIAKTTADICRNNDIFAAKFGKQCRLAVAANNAIEAENKPKKDKAKRAKIRKANQPSLYSRMTGRSNKVDPVEPDDYMSDDGMTDVSLDDSTFGDDFGDSSSQVCSAQQMQSPYGMPPVYGQAPYGMPPAYGQAPYGVDPSAPSSYAQSMYGAQPQYGLPAYGYQQPQQGVYQDPSMSGQMAYPQGGYPQAPGVAPAYTGQIVNTPQGPVCSCPR